MCYNIDSEGDKEALQKKGRMNMKKVSVDANTLGYLWELYMIDYWKFQKELREHGLTLGEFKRLCEESEEE